MTEISPEEAIEDADYHEKNGELDVAIYVLKQAADSSPDHPKLRALLGRLLYLAGQNNAAISEFDAALSLKPDAATTLYFRARAKLKIDLLDEALVDFAAVLQLQPRASDALNQISLILEFQKKYEESLSYLNRAVAIDASKFEAAAERTGILESKIQGNSNDIC